MLGLPLLSYSSANVRPGTSLMTIKSQRVSPADPRQWMIIKGKARAGSLFIVGCAVESLTSFSATVGIWNWGTPLTAFSTRLCAASRTIHTPSSIRPAGPATFSMVEYCPTPSFVINCDFKAGSARSAAPPMRSSCTSNPAPPTLRVVSPTLADGAGAADTKRWASESPTSFVSPMSSLTCQPMPFAERPTMVPLYLTLLLRAVYETRCPAVSPRPPAALGVTMDGAAAPRTVVVVMGDAYEVGVVTAPAGVRRQASVSSTSLVAPPSRRICHALRPGTRPITTALCGTLCDLGM